MTKKGIRSYEEKERRKIRRENREKKDLRYPKRKVNKLEDNYEDDTDFD